MSLDHILLGLLAESASGYRIKNELDRRLGGIWTAERSQIYRTLRNLETRGLLESRLQPSDTGPTQRIYRRTPDGRRALLDWLHSAPAATEERIGYLAQVFFADELDSLGPTEEILQAVRDHHAARLEELEKRSRADGTDESADGAAFFERLSRAHGEVVSRATVDWAEAAIAAVQTRRRQRFLNWRDDAEDSVEP